MIGYGDAVTNGGAWRWVLTAAGISESWSGSLDEGVNGATDLLVRNAQAFAALPESSVLVEIEGVPSLKEYAHVADILGSAAAVRSVQLTEASGGRATFTVLTRGGGDALQAALSAHGSFERIEPSGGGTLAFRYHP
jgi:hypothetical protein